MNTRLLQTAVILVAFIISAIGLSLAFEDARAEEFGGLSGLPTRDGKVLISKHDFLMLQQFLTKRGEAEEEMQATSDWWRERYNKAEECAREKVKAHKMVMPCFNDQET